VTARHAVLPIGAILVLGLGVYLFVEVRAQPAPPEVVAPSRASQLASNEEVATPSPAPTPAVPTPAVRGRIYHDPSMQPLGRPSPASPPSLATGSAATDDGLAAGPKLDSVMDEANKAYDHGDFEEAKTVAGRVLARFPTNVRMLRIMVSASCIDGDAAVAQAHYGKLPATDQEQMKVRCARYGVTFP
jgi:hypothetical protein